MLSKACEIYSTFDSGRILFVLILCIKKSTVYLLLNEQSSCDSKVPKGMCISGWFWKMFLIPQRGKLVTKRTQGSS